MVGGVPWVVSEIWMNIVVDEKRRGRVMGVYAMLVARGMALGPLVLQVVGVYGPAPFLTSAALALPVAVPLLTSWKSAPAIIPTADGGFARWWFWPRSRCWRPSPAAWASRWRSASCRSTRSAPASRRDRRNWLSVFVIGNLVLQWPIGWLADHLDRRAVLAGCALASAALVLLLSPCRPTPSRSSVVVLLWGGISFAIYPVGLALLGQRFSGGDIARANTAFSMLYILGGLIGRPLDRCGDGRDRRSGLGWTLAFVLWPRPASPPCWRFAAAADNPAGP